MSMHILGADGFYEAEEDAYYVMRLRDQHQSEQDRHGACDDDCEVTAPYVGMLPDESGKENGSPLDFREFSDQEIEQQIQAAFEKGLT
jgi:hypothetical protein